MTFQPTSDQQEAIERIAGDLFISAGAGSGKTAVLARRFARAVANGAGTDEVLAITFTHKAAGEVAERVRRVLRFEAELPDAALAIQHAWISTIHGFCSRIVRRHAIEAGIAPGFRVLDPAEAGLVRERAFEEVVEEMWAEGRVQELFSALGGEKTREAVLRLHDKLRSLGASSDDLAEVECDSVAEATASALAAVDAALAAHPEQPANATQASNAETLRTVLSALTGLQGLPEDERASGAGEAADCRLRKTCPTTKAAVATAADALKELAGAVRDLELARHAGALREILGGFDRRYRELKVAAGALDQDDLQEAVVALFRRHPAIARSYAQRFRMMMVDEFQDTNELQLGVIEPLRRDDLCVVGDERQAIYSFRYADVEVFRRVRAGITRRVSLDTNFRSHPEVLAFVNTVFGAEALFGEGYAPLLAPQPAEGEHEAPGAADGDARSVPRAPRAEVLLVEREGWEGRRWREAEAAALAERLAEVVRSGEAQPGEIVVLLRNFTNSALYIAALEEAGLPAAISGGGAFCDQPEIVELEALLAVAALPEDAESLAKLLLGGLADLSADTLLALRARAMERGEGTWEAVCAGAEGGLLIGDAQAQRLRAVCDAVRIVRDESLRRGLGEALRGAVHRLGVEGTLISRGAGGRRAWANVRKLCRMADSFDSEDNGDPAGFVDRLRALRRLGKLGQASAAAGDAVRLMTIHAAKGLEFPVVAVADLGHRLREPSDIVLVAPSARDGLRWSLQLPDAHDGRSGHKPRSWLRLQEEERERQRAEEKRLLYVACTRAEQRLILSGVAKFDEAEDDTAAAWVRSALELTPDVGEPGERVTGDATWTLRTVRPQESPGVRIDVPEATVTAVASPAERVPDAIQRIAETAGEIPGSDVLGPFSALSFTALKTLELCPYRFYAERILRLTRCSSGESVALDFGNALHAALQAAVPEPAGAADPAALPPAVLSLAEDRLAAIASAHGLPAGDLPRLAAAFAAFAESEVASRAYAGQRVQREVPFLIPLAGTRLAGAIDLLSWQGDDALVVDYKTGRKAPAGGSLADAYRLQAECYALALFESGARRVEVVFVAVERGAEWSSCTFEADAAEELRRKIEAMAARACEGPYERNERYDPQACGECAAAGALCPVSVPRRRPRDAA